MYAQQVGEVMDVGAVLVNAAGEFIGYLSLYLVCFFAIRFDEAVNLVLG